VNIGFRTRLDHELAKPEAAQDLLPHATMQYFLLPNALVVFQVDHIEVWRVEPLEVDRCRATTSVFALRGPVGDRERAYLVKNLDLLLDVTGREDFPMMRRSSAIWRRAPCPTSCSVESNQHSSTSTAASTTPSPPAASNTGPDRF